MKLTINLSSYFGLIDHCTFVCVGRVFGYGVYLSEIIEEYINENDNGENEAEAKLTFEEFLELMKENETMQKLILNIAKHFFFQIWSLPDLY